MAGKAGGAGRMALNNLAAGRRPTPPPAWQRACGRRERIYLSLTVDFALAGDVTGVLP